jgi:hypothetical protein
MSYSLFNTTESSIVITQPQSLTASCNKTQNTGKSEHAFINNFLPSLYIIAVYINAASHTKKITIKGELNIP